MYPTGQARFLIGQGGSNYVFWAWNEKNYLVAPGFFFRLSPGR